MDRMKSSVPTSPPSVVPDPSSHRERRATQSPETIRRSSRKETVAVQVLGAGSRRTCFPVATSHSRTVSSPAAEKTRFPSDENATLWIG